MVAQVRRQVQRYGASYLRPPDPIALDRTLGDGETFDWKGFRINCISTPGHSPGPCAYLLEGNGKTIGFTGGHFHDGAKLSTWFDSEWDYGFGKGIDALDRPKKDLAKPAIDPLSRSPHCPGHPTTRNLQGKLTGFRASYLRGYPVHKILRKKRTGIPNQPSSLS